MPEFLQLFPPHVALNRLLKELPETIRTPEEVDVDAALGRVLAETVVSLENLPSFTRTTVDGFAVRAGDTYGASDSLPAYLTLIGEVPMGGSPVFSLSDGQAALIHTGGMLPEGSDAVVMLEHVQEARPGEIEVLRAVAPGENILLRGEDISEGQPVLEAGTRLRPAEIGGLLALGILRVKVTKKPLIGILSSGDEVIPPGETPVPGQVRDINSYSLSALVEQVGGVPKRYGIVPDRREALAGALSQALSECDGVIITAGSSASTRDFTAEVISQMGKPGVLVHGVNVRPGKPTILAVCDSKPVIGLPGNPVSALVIAHLFVAPMIDRLSGIQTSRPRPTVSGRLSVNLPSQAGREDYLPARLVQKTDGLWVEPVYFKSNLIFTLGKADGLLYIPADATGLSAGDWVDVLLL